MSDLHSSTPPPFYPSGQDPAMDTLLGTLVDTRYLITQQIGWGGMGAVYQADDQRLHERPCALKVLNRHDSTPEDQARFAQELRIVSRLRSPNTVQIFDTGSLPDGRPYIAMELLEGQTLSEYLRRTGPLPPRQAVRLAEGILVALDEAHGEGIVHRDLKPANILLIPAGAGRFHPKVLDFGIAAEPRPDQPPAAPAGTPSYMAPEQFLGHRADPRTDLYALGVILYRMLSGRLPFNRQDRLPSGAPALSGDEALAWLHCTQPPPSIPQVPKPLWRVILRLLAKQPEDRFRAASEVTAALRELTRRGHLRTGDQPLAPPWRPARRLAPQAFTPPSGPFVGEATAPPPAAAQRRDRRFQIVAGLGLLALVYLLTSGALDPAPVTSDPVTAVALLEETPMCRHTLQTEPSGATLKRGVLTLGVTPALIERPCGDPWIVRVMAPDHAPTLVHLTDKTPEGLQPLVRLKPVTLPPLADEPTVDEAPSALAPEAQAEAKSQAKTKAPGTSKRASPPPRPSVAKTPSAKARSGAAPSAPQRAARTRSASKRAVAKPPAPRRAASRPTPRPAPTPAAPAGDPLPF